MTREKRICSVEWCDRPHHSKGMCRTHDMRRRAGLDMDTPFRQYERGERVCKVEGCDRPRDTHGTYCPMHLQRLSREGEVGAVEPSRRPSARTAGLPRKKHGVGPSWNEPEYLRAYRLMLDYQLTEAELLSRIEAQQNGCAICSQQLVSEDIDPLKYREFAIDHDHKTGKVRGLLCHGCNKGLGMLGEDYGRVLKAADYLKRSTE
jgi:hypothetical protein